MASKLPTIGPFPFGVNNRKADHDLTQRVDGGAVDLLRSATNVDLDDSGHVARRPGYVLALEAEGAHSLWGHGDTGFYAAGETLYQLHAMGDSLRAVALRHDLAPGLPLSFCEVAGAYFYTGSGKLAQVRDGRSIDFTPPLAAVPVLAATAGALPAGRYQVVFTQLGESGESPATPIQTLVLAEQGGIAITAIPEPVPGAMLLAYMTAPDGEVFGRVHLQIAGGEALVAVPPALGARCPTLMLDSMPAGTIVRHAGARLLVAVGNVLCYSEPFAPGLYRPSKNFIPFPAPVTVVEPCGGGVFVVADKTYWLAGDLASAALTERLPYGAVPHSGSEHPTDSDMVMWISERGLVYGSADGAVRNVQEKHLALAGGAAGATLYREREGLAHVLTAVREPLQTRAAASSYFDAEIVRKGVVL